MAYVDENGVAKIWEKIKSTFAKKEDVDASGSAQEALQQANAYTDQTAEEIGTVMGNKVDKVSGKGLSTNDYTTAEKNKLAGIAAGATKTVVDTALNTTSTNPVQNKAVAAKLDTIDSTIAQNLTATKDYTDSAYQQSTGYTDQKVAELINGAPSTLDTLKEIADAMQENQNIVESLENAIGSKASQAEVDGHTGNNTVHITAAERTKWNDANTKKHTHANKSVIDGITAALITAWNKAVEHISDTVGHISAAERTKWNAIDNKVDVDKGFIGYRGVISEADLDTFVNRESGCYRVMETSASKLLLVFNQKKGSASGLEILTSWTLATLRVRGIIDSNRYTAWKDIALLSSNVASATKLETPRNINGVAFDGTKDINIPVDDALDAASTNPVQNAVVTARLNECFQSVSEGKSLIASAITDKGVDTAADAAFTALASNIRRINSNECYIFRAGGDAAGYFSKLNWWSDKPSLVDFGNAGIVIRNTSSARNIYASAEIIEIPEGAKRIEFVFTCAGYAVAGEFRAELLDPVSETVLRTSSETLPGASPIPKKIELDVSSHNGCRATLKITSERTTKDGNGNTTVIPYALYKFD